MAQGDESTARGAALMAAVEAGVIPSLEDAFATADQGTVCGAQTENYERYQAGRARQRQLEEMFVASGAFA